MSKFAQHARTQTDQAISRVYDRLSIEPRAGEGFRRLLDVVRQRSTLLRCHTVWPNGRDLRVEALYHLARFVSHWRRPIESWPGALGSLYAIVESLAHHLLAEYRVPRFLCSVWYGNDGLYDDEKRRWFIAHSRGASFRSLPLPCSMTRRIERIFLGSPDHLTVEQAMRRAEILALGGNQPLVNAVLGTRIGHDLGHADFWREVMAFFVRVKEDLDPADVGPIIDFLQFVRHERIEVQADEGWITLAPPDPDFSMKGRTLASVLRLIDSWHRRLGRAPGRSVGWSRSRYRPMTFAEPVLDPDKPPVVWELSELTRSNELRMEGAHLQHCVASYLYDCLEGRSRIWSLRRRTERQTRSVVTIEIEPYSNSIVQARGLRNRPVSGKPLRLIEKWAQREGLRIAYR